MQKNKRTVKLMLITSMLFVIGCSDDVESLTGAEQLLEENQDLNQDITYNVLDWTPTVYHDFFKTTENVAGFNSLKNPLLESSIVQSQDFSDTATKSSLSINSDKVTITNKREKLSSAKGQDLFGRDVTFTLNSPEGKTFKNGSSEMSVSMYVPKQLEISNPLVANEDEILPYCLANNFVLEWNADPQNKEGLVIVAEYDGLTAIPSKAGTGGPVTNTMNIVNDNGKIVLSDDLWKDIPDTAFVNLSILRGNVKIEEIDEENYKFYALAQSVVPIVLIKDINSIQR